MKKTVNRPRKAKSSQELVQLKVWSTNGVSRERLTGLFNGVEKYKIKYTPPQEGASGINGAGELEVIATL